MTIYLFFYVYIFLFSYICNLFKNTNINNITKYAYNNIIYISITSIIIYLQ